MTDFAATDQHQAIRDSIRGALKGWRRFVVAIDGTDGAGKTTLGRYLSWQLGMSLVETDLFLDKSIGGLNYRLDDLARVIQSRLASDRPIMVEGVRVLEVLERLHVPCDFLVWVEQEGREPSRTFVQQLAEYERRFNPRKAASEIFTWKPDLSDFADA